MEAHARPLQRWCCHRARCTRPEELEVYPFELRFLARREPPNRWVIDLTRDDDRLRPPQKYYRVEFPEDRLFVPSEYVPLFEHKRLAAGTLRSWPRYFRHDAHIVHAPVIGAEGRRHDSWLSPGCERLRRARLARAGTRRRGAA
jgi:hypothetical protein